MQNFNENDKIIELFIVESNQLVEQLETIILLCESNEDLSLENINNIFRIMHTIKGSSAMISFNKISELSHSIEDIFFYIREHDETQYNYETIYKLIFEFIDYMKIELVKIENFHEPDGDCQDLIEHSKALLKSLKSSSLKKGKKQAQNKMTSENTIGEGETCYCVKVLFEKDSEMENVRSHLLLYSLKELDIKVLKTEPENLDLEASSGIIRNQGLFFTISSKADIKDIEKIILSALTLESYKIISVEKIPDRIKTLFDAPPDSKNSDDSRNLERHQNYISVHPDKLNTLMDLVGELVISESLIANNPDLEGLKLENFNKSMLGFKKLINELQDVVFEMRMLPVEVVFNKMHRIVRDISKKSGKKIEFTVSGGDVQMDKSAIDSLSDPIMHLVRNAADHGIEEKAIREKLNKPLTGSISLKAWQDSSYAYISVSDDGKGLNKKEIYEKAQSKALVNKDFEDMTEKEIFSLILYPGFSTREEVTEFSGRGVGMDVVKQSLDSIGGKISILSEEGKGTSITLRIPLTLLIVNVLHISVGNMKLALPSDNIVEIRKADKKDIIEDPDGNEALFLRGECYPIIRLNKFFESDTEILSLEDGILVIVKEDNETVCLFADKIIGEQQVVVKPLPLYIKKTKGILGCSIQSDGSLCLILDVNDILNAKESELLWHMF
ncbi:MAG: chemotaxis protein CheA [Bacillota bacterium]|nr:chemotaxis protein CheA [Bacillota bacterium]